MRRIIFWAGVLIFFCVVSWFAFTALFNDKSDVTTTVTETVQTTGLPESSKTYAPVVIPDKTSAINDKKAAVTPNSKQTLQKPLNLEIGDTSKPTESSSVSEVGPVQPAPETTVTNSPENTILLDGTQPKKDKLLYGYEGKDKDDNVNLMIGVQKDDVTIKSGIKKGEDQTDVQSIEIEVKLPK
ncbi:hypothetical protein [Thiomicrorhabdus sp.]|uniref:hypothetical protein n=1 Tax=Thiomicrorhabdus sp. TaxID=2039724 RepID=UPI003564277D